MVNQSHRAFLPSGYIKDHVEAATGHSFSAHLRPLASPVSCPYEATATVILGTSDLGVRGSFGTIARVAGICLFLN